MDKNSQIKKLLESFGLKDNFPITATVVSIENDTCTVKLQSSLVLSDVRLKATITDGTDSFLIVPKIASQVVVFSQTGELSGLMVIKIDAVESISYKKGGLEFLVDGTEGKVTLKNNGANFGALITSLIDTIIGAVIVTPSGAGTIDPATQTQLLELKTAFKTILNSD